MHSIIRNVDELAANDRQTLEHLLGEPLCDGQRLLIEVVDSAAAHGPPKEAPSLPHWCNVYEGLSDEEIADLEQTILKRADLSREVD